MSQELLFTALTALFAASLWVPYIVGVNTTRFAGSDTAFHRPPTQANMAPWVHRAHRAHLNLLEQFLPFAVLVLIGHSLGLTSVWFGWLAVAFFVLRLAHAGIMMFNIISMPARPLVFTVCWVITLVYGVLVLVLANDIAV